MQRRDLTETSPKPRLVGQRTCAARWKAIAGSVLAAPLAAALYLTFAPPHYRAEARIFIAPASGPSLTQEAAFVASRDVGRQALKELGVAAPSDFDPASDSAGVIARPLIFLGLANAPGEPAAERLLGGFLGRLEVGVREQEGVIAVAFRSRNPGFAAQAANSVARLYLAARAQTPGAEDAVGPAPVLAPAATPRRPAPPRPGAVLAAAAAGFTLAALAFGAFFGRSRGADSEETPSLPRAVGETPAFIRLRGGAGLSPFPGAAARGAEAANAKALDELVDRIAAARRRSGGLRIVGAGLPSIESGCDVMLTLARLSGRAGRAILISLDGGRGLRALAGSEGAALKDLLAGRASFSEAIRRDPASRLHFVAPSDPGPIDIDELCDVIDALAGAYDFIFVATPALGDGGLARSLAADADFVVLSSSGLPGAEGFAGPADLLASGAREVLVIGAPLPAPRFGRDAA